MTTRRTTLPTQAEIEQHFLDSLTLLRSVRRTLSNLLDRVDDGDDSPLREIGQKQAELETALKRAFEAEERFNAQMEKTSGLRGASEIDFAALREEIACRLNTLRSCCQEGA